MPVMTPKRAYAGQDWCPVARTLDIVGDRWTVLVLRDIFHRKRKFKELMESLQGISPNLLADRLKRLEERGFVFRRFYSDHPPRAEYLLTDKGKAFGPVLMALRDFGDAWEPPEDEPDP
jgi:DNA-binding HxlR family transcriptional regulator